MREIERQFRICSGATRNISVPKNDFCAFTMDLRVALAGLLVFSAACYLMMGSRLLSGKREIGSMPIGTAYSLYALWVCWMNPETKAVFDQN